MGDFCMACAPCVSISSFFYLSVEYPGGQKSRWPPARRKDACIEVSKMGIAANQALKWHPDTADLGLSEVCTHTQGRLPLGESKFDLLQPHPFDPTRNELLRT